MADIKVLNIIRKAFGCSQKSPDLLAQELLKAVLANNFKKVYNMLNNGVDPNYLYATDKGGCYLLDIKAISAEIVQLLFAFGARTSDGICIDSRTGENEAKRLLRKIQDRERNAKAEARRKTKEAAIEAKRRKAEAKRKAKEKAAEDKRKAKERAAKVKLKAKEKAAKKARKALEEQNLMMILKQEAKALISDLSVEQMDEEEKYKLFEKALKTDDCRLAYAMLLSDCWANTCRFSDNDLPLDMAKSSRMKKILKSFGGKTRFDYDFDYKYMKHMTRKESIIASYEDVLSNARNDEEVAFWHEALNRDLNSMV